MLMSVLCTVCWVEAIRVPSQACANQKLAIDVVVGLAILRVFWAFSPHLNAHPAHACRDTVAVAVAVTVTVTVTMTMTMTVAVS